MVMKASDITTSMPTRRRFGTGERLAPALAVDGTLLAGLRVVGTLRVASRAGRARPPGGWGAGPRRLGRRSVNGGRVPAGGVTDGPPADASRDSRKSHPE